MFTLRGFIKSGLLMAVGRMADYQIILNAAGWMDKGVLTEGDLEEIQQMMGLQTEEETEQEAEPETGEETEQEAEPGTGEETEQEAEPGTGEEAEQAAEPGTEEENK